MKQCIGAWLAVFLLCASTSSSWGQAAETQQEEAQPAAISDERLEELITTLESETARGKFIDNLKTLLEAQQATGEPKGQDAIDLPVADVLPMPEDWSARYQAFLEKHELAQSTVTNALGTAGLIIAGLVIYWIAGRAIKTARRRSSGLMARFHVNQRRLHIYSRILRGAILLFLILFTLFAVLDLWQVDYQRVINAQTVQAFYEKLFSILIVFLLAAALFEAANSASELMLQRSSAQASARMNTLLPIIRWVISVSLIIVFGMVILAELGINVAPMLAGAGILGVAVGFGAQTAVKDFLTGFIIILEDLIQVGDVASVGGKTGIVERITVRKVQMRDLDGRVYTVPFSEIAIVENLTKEFSYYLMEVGVAYRENTDEVVACLREIDEQMRNEEPFSELMLEPIDILGVDKFADSAVVIKCRLKTLPVKQWQVGREFNRRMKIAFDERGIEIPFPHRTLYFGEGKQGGAPPAYVKVDGQLAANDASRDQGGEG